MISTPYVNENETDRDSRPRVIQPPDGILALAEDDEGRLAAIAERLRATREAGGARDAQGERVPGIAIGELNVILGGPHGARLEPVSDKLLTESGAGRVDVGDPPTSDLRSGATRLVWDALAAGADVVRIDSGHAAASATLFRFLAAEAREHGFSDGVLFATDAGGPAADVAQRLATQIYPDQPPRYYSRTQLGLLGRGRAYLVLLLRSRLAAADVAELRGLFPEFRFVIDAAIALPQAATIELDGLSANAADGRGDDLVRAFMESRPPVERRILGILALAQVPLSNCYLSYILGALNIETELRQLVESELVRVCGPDVYELSQDVEQHLIPLADAASVRTLLVHILSDVLDRWSQAPVLDRQIAGAETFFDRADDDSLDDVVLELGPPLARMYAIRGAFGGWGRVLRTTERAAMRAGDTSALALARHDLGIRALLVGQDSDARAYLGAALAGRQRDGDSEGARATSNALLLLEPQAAREEAPRDPILAALPDESPAEKSPFEWLEPALTWLREKPFGHRLPIAALERDFHALERWFVERPSARWVMPAALCFALGLLLAGGTFLGSLVRPASDPGPQIVNFSAHPRELSAGRSATLCVDAHAVAVVEIFPTATHFSGSGNHCVGVSPRFTTAYVAVGSAADGRQVRGEILVSVHGTAAPGGAQGVTIADFAAHPRRIRFGQSTRLCYAATGAHFLRVVPPIGKLVRLQACQTVTPPAIGRYGYTLWAIGDRGQVAVRRLRVDVLAAGPAPARPSR